MEKPEMPDVTPGPWIAEEVGDSGGDNPVSVYEVTTADGYRRVCEHLYEADAKLIAAAPDLLLCLFDYVKSDHLGSTLATERFQRAHAAIAKAFGVQA